MSDVMIRVENLGKKYIIGYQAQGQSNYVALRDVLTDGARSLVRRFTGRSEGTTTREEFWALKDVSFEVKRGECGDYWSQWGGEIDVIKNPEPDYGTDNGPH